MQKGKTPDFIIIGGQKCGTTSFQTVLKDICPNTFLPKTESVHYFTNHWEKPLSWYQSFFPVIPGIVVGECSRFYCMHPLTPERIKEKCPEVKLIYLVRNPVNRAYSHYCDKVHLGLLDKKVTFEQALDIENKELEGEWEFMLNNVNYPHGLPYREYTFLTKGRYAEILSRWYKHFPQEQILLIKSEDYFSNSREVFKTVFNFLGIEDTSDRVPLRFLANKGWYKEPINPQTREKLVEYFKPHNERLYKLIGKDFGWR